MNESKTSSEEKRIVTIDDSDNDYDDGIEENVPLSYTFKIENCYSLCGKESEVLSDEKDELYDNPNFDRLIDKELMYKLLIAGCRMIQMKNRYYMSIIEFIFSCSDSYIYGVTKIFCGCDIGDTLSTKDCLEFFISIIYCGLDNIDVKVLRNNDLDGILKLGGCNRIYKRGRPSKGCSLHRGLLREHIRLKVIRSLSRKFLDDEEVSTFIDIQYTILDISPDTNLKFSKKRSTEKNLKLIHYGIYLENKKIRDLVKRELDGNIGVSGIIGVIDDFLSDTNLDELYKSIGYVIPSSVKGIENIYYYLFLMLDSYEDVLYHEIKYSHILNGNMKYTSFSDVAILSRFPHLSNFRNRRNLIRMFIMACQKERELLKDAIKKLDEGKIINREAIKLGENDFDEGWSGL